MGMRLYENLVDEAGINDLSTSIPGGSGVNKLMSSYSGVMEHKALQRVVIGGIVIWSLLMFFFIFPTFMDDGGSFLLLIPLFCIGPIVIALGAIGIYGLVLNMVFDTPELMMSAVALRRGDELSIRYKQPVKRDITLKSVAFTLILRETATYDQGTNTVTETHDHTIRQEIDFDVSVSQMMGGIQRQLNFIIPDDAMHTFDEYRNSLHWYLTVKFDIPNYPDYQKAYKLQVLPEVNNEN